MGKGGIFVTQNAVCEKCKKPFQREIRVADPELHDASLSDTEKADRSASNTQKAFCPVCEGKFIEWMRKKGYLATDCWCSHIDEYKGVHNA